MMNLPSLLLATLSTYTIPPQAIVEHRFGYYDGPRYEFPLGQLAYENNLEEVKRLVALGHSIDNNRHEVLLAAIRNNNYEMIEYLLAHGADINFNSLLAVRQAVCDGSLEMVEFLIQKGAKVAHKSVVQSSQAHDLWREKSKEFATEDHHVKMVTLLLKHDSCLHYNDPEALIEAIRYGCDQTVELLIQHGTDIHIKKDKPFRKAAKGGNPNIQKLLKFFEHVDMAYRENSPAFITDHPDINKPFGNRERMLHWAAKCGRLDDIKILLARGAYTNVCDEDGKAPLMHAACLGLAPIARELLAHGALPTIKDKGGQNALDYALQSNDIKTAFIVVHALKKHDNAKQIAQNEKLTEVDQLRLTALDTLIKHAFEKV